MRTSSDQVDQEGVVVNGFDYDLQVWVRDYIVLDCWHPNRFSVTQWPCCEAHKLAGCDIRNI